MIRIRTPSRLHFGLLSLQSPETIGARQWGGVGLMVDRPGIELTIAPASDWHADGPLAERALDLARRYCAATGCRQSFHLTITNAASEHAGLGTGTQLALAVARGIAELADHSPIDTVRLAALVGRGTRSALGIHGFDRGGFLVDGGKGPTTTVAPLLCRLDFPIDWQILLVTLHDIASTHGSREVDAFTSLTRTDDADRSTDALCRLVLLGMLPALVERDLDSFGEAVYEFNRRVGELFAAVQGGTYAHPSIERMVQLLRSAGVKGVGQSSWGPTVFALAPANQMPDLRDWLARQTGANGGSIVVTAVSPAGAVVASYS